jgi:hypothetical protein
MQNDTRPNLPHQRTHLFFMTTSELLGAGPRPKFYEARNDLYLDHEHYGRETSSRTSMEKSNTSLDFTQRLEKKLAKFNTSDNVFKRWLFEMMSLFISAACMVAIVLIYIQISNKPMSTVGSLLTVTNTLGKVSSAALIVPTSEALGQLKWNWFHNSKAMWDFEIFDKASRGPLGALMLLYRTKGRSLAALGALLIVLLLAIDTFFQQVVDYPEVWLQQVTNSSIPRVVRYEPVYSSEFVNGEERSQFDQDILRIADTFFLGKGTQMMQIDNGTRADIPLSCPNSKCNWLAYETLGICSDCIQAPQLLNFTCMFTRVDWTSDLNTTISSYPNATVCGYFLNATSGTPVLMAGYMVDDAGGPIGEALLMRTLPLLTNPLREPLWGGSINFKNRRNPLADVLISSTLGLPQVYANEPPIIHECVLSWCIKTIESSYTFGAYFENVTKTFINDTNDGSPWVTEFDPVDGGTWIDYIENITISAPSTGQNFSEYGWGVNNTTMINTVMVFDRIFPAFTTAANDTAEPLLRWRTGSRTDVRTRKLDFNPWLLPNDIASHLERMTTVMTNSIRSSTSNEMIAGEAWATETIVSIHWQWLTFPLLILVSSVVFLIATINKTSKNMSTGVWKTSAMPTLIYGLPKETQSQFTSSTAFIKAEHNNKVHIRLSMKAGWRVSGQQSLQIPRPAHQAPDGWI